MPQTPPPVEPGVPAGPPTTHPERVSISGPGGDASIVIAAPSFVPLSEADRRGAVDALADLLATWWRREHAATDRPQDAPHGSVTEPDR